MREVIEGAALGQGVHFLRTVTPDDIVLRQLITELLKFRNVDFGNDKIVILTEWDSIYGRWLGTVFASHASGTSYGKLFEERDKYWPRWIYLYQYFRGIDGRLPGGQTQTANEQQQGQKNGSQTPKPEESTEGANQSDFLRRLARELKDDDLHSRQKGEGRVRAIGLLGADIYDKLMILRALRPEFPEAIFFTNNFDAHFERREDWRDVRNLVIASPFGGKLPSPWQSTVTPFRDNNQTSMYMATLVATGRMGEKTALQLASKATVFEIGRKGAYDFGNSRDRYWFADWLQSSVNRLCLVGAALTLALLMLWIRLGLVDAQFPCRATRLERGKRLLCDTPLWVVWGSVVTILLVCLYAQTRDASEEPLQFCSGISIWPTEMLRLIAVILSIHFMIKASVTLKLNEQRIADRFCLLQPTLSTVNDAAKSFIGRFWRKFREGFRKFREGFISWRTAHARWRTSEEGFSVEDAWHTYLCRSRFRPRFVRVALLVVLYLVFTESLRTLFLVSRLAFAPARGEAAFHASYNISFVANLCLTVLCFYVLDAILVNGNFIRVFAPGLTKWPDSVSGGCRRNPPLSDHDLSRYHDVLFVAERTQAVANLIWYPLIVLAVLIFARSSFFDNWTWPPVIIVTDTLNAALAIGSAIFLRRMAEQLRTTAIRDLQLLRNTNYKDRRKKEAFDELLAEIRGLKVGAFAPLTEQPFVRAILLPGAGLGLLSVAQRLLES